MKEKQLQLLQFIRNRTVHLGLGPTFKEMRDHMRVASNQTIADWLNILEQEGLIKQEKGKFRGIFVTPKGMGAQFNLQKEDLSTQLPFTRHYGDSTSASFDPGIYVANTLPPTIIRSATIEGGEKSGGGT
jgi:SOS-response transcriptional repressor LexA